MKVVYCIQSTQRAFVLAPLAEIAPALRIGDADVATLAQNCDSAGLRVDKAATERVRLE